MACNLDNPPMLTPQTATRTHGDYTVTKYATPDGYRYVVFHLGERVAVCASYDEARETVADITALKLSVVDDRLRAVKNAHQLHTIWMN